MKLLQVVPTYLPATRYGGPIYSVHALSAALAHRGHEVHVYTTNVDGPGVSPVPLGVEAQRDGVRIWYFPTGVGRRLYRSPAMYSALVSNLSSFDAVHLHSVFLWPTSAAAYLARLVQLPYVLAPRGMLGADLIQRKSMLLKKAWIAAFERRNLAQAAAVHVTSNLEADDLARMRLPVQRIAVIPNGIDPPPEAIGFVDRGLVSSGPVTVMSLGRINWKKGLDRLIQAVARVPDARLVIAGNDEESYTQQLQAIAVHHGVAQRTTFPGPSYGEEKWRLLANADVFALPSYSENFGIAVLEAMACGIPVVVTPEVGLASAVVEAGAGLVADGNPATLGAAIARLVANPALRQRMGDAGRRAAIERFSWSTVARDVEALYLDIIASQAPRP